MSFTLHQLRIFESVARNGSITGAAAELHMTQPAVSIQIKQLQDHFGLEFTEVIGRRLYLTDAGQDLFELVRDLNRRLDDLEAVMAERRGTVRGKLHFSVVSTGKYFMPHFLGLYKQKQPGIDLQLQVTNRFSVLKHLEENMTDFAVVSLDPEQLPHDFMPIMDNPLVVAAHPDMTIPDKTIEFIDLKDQPFVLREEGSGTRMVMLDLFKKNSMDPTVTFELDTNEAIKQAIMAGFGISILSRFSLKSELTSGEIREVPVRGFPVMTRWQLVWLKGKNLSPAARSFLQFMKDEKESIIEKNFSWVYEL